MNWSKELDAWSAKNHSAFILGLRVLLGVVLLIKGYLFMFNVNDLSDVVQALGMASFNVTLALIVAWAHLLCGLFILAGLMVRISCVILFPILVGAVFYVNLRMGFVTSSEWMLSVVILYLLVFFFAHGAGELSVYNLFLKAEREHQVV